MDKLREAILESGNQDLTVKDHLRLPMYLLLAGKGEEGWAVLSDLDSKHRHAVSQVEIADQMRVFLMKDGRPKEAAFYAVWALCKEIERDRWLLRGIEKKADKLANNPSLASRYAGREVFATTPNQNPIRDSFYLTIKQRIEEGCTTSEVDRVLRPILKKAKMEDRVSEISRVAAAYLGSRMRYDLKSLQKVIGHFLV